MSICDNVIATIILAPFAILGWIFDYQILILPLLVMCCGCCSLDHAVRHKLEELPFNLPEHLRE